MDFAQKRSAKRNSQVAQAFPSIALVIFNFLQTFISFGLFLLIVSLFNHVYIFVFVYTYTYRNCWIHILDVSYDALPLEINRATVVVVAIQPEALNSFHTSTTLSRWIELI